MSKLEKQPGPADSTSDPYRRLLFSLALLVVLHVVGVVGYSLLVGSNWFDSLYMTVITLTGVGFGEVLEGLEGNLPGRTFTIVLILSGMGFLLYAVSSITAVLIEGDLTNMIRRRRMDHQIGKMKNHIVVCGAGITAVHVIEELGAVGKQFVVIEPDPSNLERALEEGTFPYIQGEPTEESFLLQAGIQRALAVVVDLNNDRDTLYVTFVARQLNPSARIVASGLDQQHIGDRLTRAGADAVVFPSRIGGLRMAAELIRPHVVGFLDTMLRAGDATWRFEEIEITSESASLGQPLGSLRIGEDLGLPVLALADGEQITYYPPLDTVLREHNRLVVMADRPRMERLRERVAGSEAP